MNVEATTGPPASQLAHHLIHATEPSLQFPGAWVSTTAGELGTDDHEFADLALRSWLQMLRDRLTVEVADRFADALPALVRDIFCAEWNSDDAPVKDDYKAYTIRFARSTRIAVQDVRAVAAAATAAVARLVPTDAVSAALAALHPDLRAMISPQSALSEAC